MIYNRCLKQIEASVWNYIYCISDVHFGNALCDETKFKSDLEEAKKLNADIFIIGDFFDAIYSGDPRYKSSVLASWLWGTDTPLNKAIHEAETLLKPYAGNIRLISLGNHEHTIIKYHVNDPISTLINNLNIDLPPDQHIRHGGYIGFFQYVTRTSEKGQTNTFDIMYYHGKGGSAPVTKGMIDFNRMAASFNYDALLMGHNHFRMGDATARMGISGKGKPKYWLMKHVRCGAYLKSYMETDSSIVPYSELKAFSPIDTGCAIVKWRYTGSCSARRLEVKAEI